MISILVRFLKWLMLPETKQAYEQQQQPTQQPIFYYDPQQIYQPQQQPESPRHGVSWKTFMLDQGTKGLMFRIFSGKKYIEDLEECYMQLLEEKADSRLYDVSELLQKYNGLYHDYKALEVNLAVANAKLLHQNTQTDLALGMTTKAQRQAQLLREHGYEPVQKEQQRDGNKFASANGNSKRENEMIIAAMDAYGISRKEIAEEIGVSIATVTTYASSMKKHYDTYGVNNNGEKKRMISFDSDYGGELWDLTEVYGDTWEFTQDNEGNRKAIRIQDDEYEEEADYLDEEEEYPEADSYSHKGVIDRNIKY